MSNSLKAACDLVFADLAEKLFMLDITTKVKDFHLIGFYAPSDQFDRPDLFQLIDLFLTAS